MSYQSTLNLERYHKKKSYDDIIKELNNVKSNAIQIPTNNQFINNKTIKNALSRSLYILKESYDYISSNKKSI